MWVFDGVCECSYVFYVLMVVLGKIWCGMYDDLMGWKIIYVKIGFYVEMYVGGVGGDCCCGWCIDVDFCVDGWLDWFVYD